MAGYRDCPNCGEKLHTSATWCQCGAEFRGVTPIAAAPGAKTSGTSIVWALLPALLVLAGASAFMMKQSGLLGAAAAQEEKAAPALTKFKGCLEVYSLDANQKAREESTVVRGMIRNACTQTVKSLKILIQVEDENGNAAKAWTAVTKLDVGQAKPFEKAWTGKLATYRVVEVR
jgi:hypothetical protein